MPSPPQFDLQGFRRPIPTVRILLWVLAIGLGVWLGLDRWANPMPVTQDWRTPLEMADFRDTIWLPGHYVLDGGNPYDPELYKSDHPYAQEFSPYAPAWLLLSVGFSLLPFQAATAAYLVFGYLLAVLLLHLLFRWAAPELHWIGVPALLVWFTIWSPTRYHLQTGGNFLVAIGVLLVMIALVESSRETPTTRPWWCGPEVAAALGIGLVMIKPQFGLLLLLALLAAGLWRGALAGLTGLSVVSLPTAIACSISAGGVLPFVDSVLRDAAYSSSTEAPTGLGVASSPRTDILGIAARWGVVVDGWVSLLVPLLAAAVIVFLVRSIHRLAALTVVAGVCAATLIGIVHLNYDAIILVVPFVVMLNSLSQSPFRSWLRLPSVNPVIGGCLVVALLPWAAVLTRLAGLPGRQVADTILLAAQFAIVVTALCLLAIRRTGLPRESSARKN